MIKESAKCPAAARPRRPTSANRGMPSSLIVDISSLGMPGSLWSYTRRISASRTSGRCPSDGHVRTRSRSACGRPPKGNVARADYTTASGRTFHVWGPTPYDQNKAYPVVFAFHGLGTDGLSFEDWFHMEDYVNNEAFVIYPDAVLPGTDVNNLWDVDGTFDLIFFDDMVKQLGETYCINPSRIFGFGFSWGAHFVHHLGCQRAGYVRAISAGDGNWGGDDISRCGRLPVLVTHRTKDTDEFLAWGKATVDNWVAINQCTSDTVSQPYVDPTDGLYVARPCTIHPNCKDPGVTVTFCEDTYVIDPSIPGYNDDWNHTVRDVYRAYTWDWFNQFK